MAVVTVQQQSAWKQIVTRLRASEQDNSGRPTLHITCRATLSKPGVLKAKARGGVHQPETGAAVNTCKHGLVATPATAGPTHRKLEIGYGGRQSPVTVSIGSLYGEHPSLPGSEAVGFWLENEAVWLLVNCFISWHARSMVGRCQGSSMSTMLALRK